MERFLIVVEGAQDAAALGLFLRLHFAFTQVKYKNRVDPALLTLIPKVYPSNKEGKLDRVVACPDFFERSVDGRDQFLVISVSGSDSQLIKNLGLTLVDLAAVELSGIGIFVDADEQGPVKKFDWLIAQLISMKNKYISDGAPLYPVRIPVRLGVEGKLGDRIGVYVFPDGKANGTMEDLLLGCARTTYADYVQDCERFVNDISSRLDINNTDLHKLRRGSGKKKAVAGVLGNLMKPGDSLVMAISDGRWFDGIMWDEVGVQELRAFFEQFFK